MEGEKEKREKKLPAFQPAEEIQLVCGNSQLPSTSLSPHLPGRGSAHQGEWGEPSCPSLPSLNLGFPFPAPLL